MTPATLATIVEIRAVDRASFWRDHSTTETDTMHETLQHARSTLRRHGARVLEEALRDNPDGPIQSITTHGACDITYEVVVGDALLGDHGQARTIWSRTVVFGQTDRTVAGGADFRDAARAQDEVVIAAHLLLSAGEAFADEATSAILGSPSPSSTNEEEDLLRAIASAPAREPPLHVVDQAGQPYGSVRRCCNMCGLMVHPGMRFVDSTAEWYASSKEGRCQIESSSR